MRVPVYNLDLTLPPARRWEGLTAHADAARRLIDSYVRDLGGLERFQGVSSELVAGYLREDLLAEVEGVAHAVGREVEQVLLANLYYDAMRALLGCTAFARDTHEGPIHARNLDWWSEQRLLSELTLEVRASGGPCGPFRTIAWPGYVGALSGIAPGRFAITLNAVLSEDPLELATPISFLLRTVLETASGFDEAVRVLTDTPIVADCLLLVSGTRSGEMVVVERTPTRCAVRGPTDGQLVVTNDYRVLDSAFVSDSELARTACSRYDRAAERVRAERPDTPEACFAILDDRAVRMDMTMQQMVLHASTGLCAVRKA